MSRHSVNARLVKIHRSYSVDEAARALAVHKNTVRDWIARGLPTIDRQRPTLILGRDLAEFLARRRSANKHPCAPGEIYCVRCRRPQPPAGGMADFEPVAATSGNLIGICPVCNALMYRRISLAKLDAVKGNLDVRLPQVTRHLDESHEPSVNHDFKRV